MTRPNQADKQGPEKVAAEQRTEPVEQPRQRLPPPFPQKLNKAKEDACFKKFFDMFRELHINLPLLDVLQGMPKSAKYLKDVETNKERLGDLETVALTEECSSRVMSKMPKKLKDPPWEFHPSHTNW